MTQKPSSMYVKTKLNSRYTLEKFITYADGAVHLETEGIEKNLPKHLK